MANLNNIKICIIIILLLNINLIFSLPQLSSSTVYGRVIDEKGEPIINTKVIAIWTDSNNELKAYTRTTESTGMVGYYKFNDINAPEGSLIKIQSNGHTIGVTAIPEIPIKAQDIIISEKETRGFIENILDFVKNIFNDDEDKENIGGLNNLKQDIENMKIKEEEYIREKNYSKEEINDSVIDLTLNNITIIDNKNDIQNDNNHAPIINISKFIYVCENDSLSYKFNIFDMDNDILEVYLDKSYPDSPFFIRELSGDLKNHYFELYSDIITKKQINNPGYRVYNEFVSVSDKNNVDNKEVQIEVIEKNNPPKIKNIGTLTSVTGKIFYHQIKVDDLEDGDEKTGNIKYKIKKDETDTLDISTEGIIHSLDEMTVPGSYKITVCATDKGLKNTHEKISLCNDDGKPKITCEDFTLNIVEKNNPPKINSVYPDNYLLKYKQGETFKLSVFKKDPDNTVPDVYWYIDNELIQYDEGKRNSEYSYKIPCNNLGTHIVEVEITDGVFNDSKEWSIEYLENLNCINEEIKCNENWGCSLFKDCTSITEMADKIMASKIRDECLKNGLNEQTCGFQKRNCIDLNKCSTENNKPLTMKICYYSKSPRCNDNIKNCHDGSCEILVDCSGPCDSCPTCNDNIKNQNEKNIDCSGVCTKCENSALFSINPMILNRIFLIFIIAFLLIAILFITNLTIKIIIMKRKISRLPTYTDKNQ